MLEGEEDAGLRKAPNGEAGEQARALDQFGGPELPGLGAHRLASCDRRRQEITKSRDQVREENVEEDNGDSDQGRPTQTSAMVPTDGAGSALGH